MTLSPKTITSLAVAAVIAATTAAGTTTTASAHSRSSTSRHAITTAREARDRKLAKRAFTILRRHGAHVADAQTVGGTVALQGSNFRVLVSQATNGEVCVWMLLTEGGGGEACGTAQNAAALGLGLTTTGIGETMQITLLLPNGVNTVTFETGSTSEPVPVVNNVATLASASLTGATYTLPNGTQEDIAVRPPPALPHPAN